MPCQIVTRGHGPVQLGNEPVTLAAHCAGERPWLFCWQLVAWVWVVAHCAGSPASIPPPANTSG